MRKWVKKSLKEDDSYEEKTSSAREVVPDGEAVSSKTKVDTAPIQRYQTHTKECFDSYSLIWFYILHFLNKGNYVCSITYESQFWSFRHQKPNLI